MLLGWNEPCAAFPPGAGTPTSSHRGEELWSGEPGEPSATSFKQLFEKVRVEDFSSYLAKLSTPRELMIMMTEMCAPLAAWSLT